VKKENPYFPEQNMFDDGEAEAKKLIKKRRELEIRMYLDQQVADKAF